MAKKKTNPVVEHWDWLVAVAGVAVLGVFLLGFLSGTDGEQTAESYEADLNARSPSGKGVAVADMSIPDAAFALVTEPPALKEIDPKDASFLGSGKRVICQNKECGKPIPAALKECRHCHTVQEAPAKVDTDTDKDGIPNEWELKYGLDAADAGDADLDKDKDGFTNREEFDAGTDPTDPDSHPDYLKYFHVAGPLKQTKLPFFFNNYMKLPGNRYRCYFVFPGRKGDYGQQLKADGVEGEEVLKTGFTIGKLTVASATRKIKGSATGATKDVDISTLVLTRKSDGKVLKVRINEQNVAVDNQGVLSFDRGEYGPFTVVPGSKVQVFNREYEVVSFGGTVQQPEIVLKDVKTGQKETVR